MKRRYLKRGERVKITRCQVGELNFSNIRTIEMDVHEMIAHDQLNTIRGTMEVSASLVTPKENEISEILYVTKNKPFVMVQEDWEVQAEQEEAGRSVPEFDMSIKI